MSSIIFAAVYLFCALLLSFWVRIIGRFSYIFVFWRSPDDIVLASMSEFNRQSCCRTKLKKLRILNEYPTPSSVSIKRFIG